MSNQDYYHKYLKYKTKYLKYIQTGGKKQGNYSNVYVFDKLNNIIKKIAYAEFNNKIHMIINDNELSKLEIGRAHV